MRPIDTELLGGRDLYRVVVLEHLLVARESVWISTANLKAMFVEDPDEADEPSRGRRDPFAMRKPPGTKGPAGAAPRRKMARTRRFRSVIELFGELSARGVELRILHAELPSRPFRAAFDAQAELVAGGLTLKICPRVHFKAVLIDGAWLYLGSANLTGAGLGAKDEHKRNFELGFVTEDHELIDRVTAMYQAIWSGAECRRCKLKSICPDPIG